MNAQNNDLQEPQSREERLFYALDTDGDGLVDLKEMRSVLYDMGLDENDPRLSHFFQVLSNAESSSIDQSEFNRILGLAGILFERALQGNLAVPDFKNFTQNLVKLYDEVLSNVGGAQADYIPPLREVNPDQFGISVVTIDGQVFTYGDALVDFSIQSTCKPFNYCFAVEELGADHVHQHIGREPSGQAFNEQVLQPDNRPHNPMINAGAIMSAALIKADAPVHRRLEHVRSFWSRMTGGTTPRYNAWMAKEETRTGDQNRALAYMMKARQCFPKGEDAVDHEIQDALDLYFSTCSLELTCKEMAIASATLANGGMCPLTQERVLARTTVRNCLSLMQMCGMYDYSGEFCFKIGVPAKSGVGGAVILVIPNLMGICIWSPRLDHIGNSVRGVAMAEALTSMYSFHLYDQISAVGTRIDPRVSLAQWKASITSQALWAASSGDLWTLRRLHAEQVNLDQGDYDERTPLHLAAAEGHIEVVRFLLKAGVDVNTIDRWGGTPLDDAIHNQQTEVETLLRESNAVEGNETHLQSEGATEYGSGYGNQTTVAELLWSAAGGSVLGVRRLVASGVPVDATDYDGRTALHLAASCGQIDVASYLITHGHSLWVRDRWNSTPLDEAKRHKHERMIHFLNNFM